MSHFEELHALLQSIEQNTALFEEEHILERTDALDLLELHILNTACGEDTQPQEWTALRRRALALSDAFKQINDQLFRRLRDKIIGRNYVPRRLMHEFRRYADLTSRTEQDGDLYDGLDVLVNGVLNFKPLPEKDVDMEPDMVAYQPTPARIILDLITQTGITPQDVFVDIGSGLGHVPIIVSVLSGAKSVGIEVQRTYCDAARHCAAGLNLSHVCFLHQDARDADFSIGTIFYMYTPFRGALLHTVIERLHNEAQSRHIWVCTYGPYMSEVAKQPWLTTVTRRTATAGPLTVFESRTR